MVVVDGEMKERRKKKKRENQKQKRNFGGGEEEGKKKNLKNKGSFFTWIQGEQGKMFIEIWFTLKRTCYRIALRGQIPRMKMMPRYMTLRGYR